MCTQKVHSSIVDNRKKLEIQILITGERIVASDGLFIYSSKWMSHIYIQPYVWILVYSKVEF